MTDRLDRLEASLTKSLAGFLTGLRSIKKPTTGNAMTTPPEVAAVLAEMRALKIPNWPAGRILGDLADRIESALTKAEAVTGWAKPHEIDDARRNKDVSAIAVFLYPERNETYSVPVYAHAPCVPVESQQADAKAAARFRWLRDHAINTEGRKGSPWCVYGLGLGDCTPTFGAELEAFVDDAMANGIVCSPVPVESLGRDADYPECSGDPASCPKNEGYGCCKPNPVKPPASVPDGSDA